MTPIDTDPRGPAVDSRVVSSDIAFVVETPAEVVLQVTAAGSAGRVIDERLQVCLDGDPVDPVVVAEPYGSRLHLVRCGVGRLEVAYRAELAPDPAAGVAAVSDYERQLYLRPSRYCPIDHLVGFAVAQFGEGPDAGARVADITEWIRRRIRYVPGSSDVHDSAEDTLLTAAGTCRDFAHLGVALCRATGIPARFAAVYAPGLSPMDFHAVFETCQDGPWQVHDATGLAPRGSLVRIVSGRDAADTAFAAVISGSATLVGLTVTATVAGDLPVDDPTEPARLR